jgi:hypothetical protein
MEDNLKVLPRDPDVKIAGIKAGIDEDFELLVHTKRRAEMLGVKLHWIKTDINGRIVEAVFESPH